MRLWSAVENWLRGLTWSWRCWIFTQPLIVYIHGDRVCDFSPSVISSPVLVKTAFYTFFFHNLNTCPYLRGVIQPQKQSIQVQGEYWNTFYHIRFLRRSSKTLLNIKLSNTNILHMLFNAIRLKQALQKQSARGGALAAFM
jgi:hypothetical protein